MCWERTGGTPTARAQLLTPLAVLFVKSDLNHAKRGEDRRGVEIKRKRSSGCPSRPEQGESMVNSKAKCLVIKQVIRAKSYNSCLIFISKNFFIIM